MQTVLNHEPEIYVSFEKTRLIIYHQGNQFCSLGLTFLTWCAVWYICTTYMLNRFPNQTFAAIYILPYTVGTQVIKFDPSKAIMITGTRVISYLLPIVRPIQTCLCWCIVLILISANYKIIVFKKGPFLSPLLDLDCIVVINTVMHVFSHWKCSWVVSCQDYTWQGLLRTTCCGFSHIVPRYFHLLLR